MKVRRTPDYCRRHAPRIITIFAKLMAQPVLIPNAMLVASSAPACLLIQRPAHASHEHGTQNNAMLLLNQSRNFSNYSPHSTGTRYPRILPRARTASTPLIPRPHSEHTQSRSASSNLAKRIQAVRARHATSRTIIPAHESNGRKRTDTRRPIPR
jgi:hypothetical protein